MWTQRKGPAGSGYSNSVEKDEEHIKQVKNLGDLVEGDIKQNYAIDIYQEYFSASMLTIHCEPPSAKTLAVFKDPSEVKRTVSNISVVSGRRQEARRRLRHHAVPGPAHGAAIEHYGLRPCGTSTTPPPIPDRSPTSPLLLPCAWLAKVLDLVWWAARTTSRRYITCYVNNPNTPATRRRRSPSCCLAPRPGLQDSSSAGTTPFECFDTRTGEAPKEVSIIEQVAPRAHTRSRGFRRRPLRVLLDVDGWPGAVVGRAQAWRASEGKIVEARAGVEGRLMGGISEVRSAAGDQSS